MTNEERIEQMRALHDAGAFKKHIVSRTPEDLHGDQATLECGHRQYVPRYGTPLTNDESWECSECRSQFDPAYKPVLKVLPWKRWLRATPGWVFLIPAVAYLVWMFFWLVPEANRAEQAKQQDYQQLKDRVSRIEEQLRQRR